MPRSRVVKPAVIRLTLTEGDWVDVKQDLNAGEYRKLLYDQMKDGGNDSPTLDLSKLGISKLLAYLIGWSFIGLDQQPLAYDVDLPEDLRRATIDSLDRETYRELIQAIDAHEDQQDRARTEKKSALTGVGVS